MAIPRTAERSLSAGTYEIDPAASTVRFATRAMFGLLPVRGTFALARGRVVVAGADGAPEPSVAVTVEAASFDSGNSKRDDHVRSADYLDVQDHPEITFRSEGFERSGEDVALRGELTVRGVTGPVVVAVDSFTAEGGRLTATGSATVDRYAFGITNGKGMTGRHLTLTLEVVAER
ncbi:YceI family protein [Streptomyces phytohabitans]|uniref:YceI family protein n=1 Tax=Streptomyces phytohabitans TaxID=1150371 RepID=UPI00345BCA0F